MNIIVEDKVIKMPDRQMTEDEFFRLCMANRDLKLERDGDGNIVVQEPVGYYGSNYEASVISGLYVWNFQTKSGRVFSSSGGFTLPNGAVRSPDVAWISNEHDKAVPESEKEKFAHICPDFVVEVTSKSDSINVLKKRMVEYMESGCQLGFLIDPYGRKAWMYRPGAEPVLVTDFTQKLSGGDLMPGYHLSLSLFSRGLKK